MIVAVTGRQDHTSYEHRMWLYEGLDMLNKLSPVSEVVSCCNKGYEHHAYNWSLWRTACGQPVKHRIVSDIMSERPDVFFVAPGTPEIASQVRQAIGQGWRVVLLEKMPVTVYRPAALSASTSPS